MNILSLRCVARYPIALVRAVRNTQNSSLPNRFRSQLSTFSTIDDSSHLEHRLRSSDSILTSVRCFSSESFAKSDAVKKLQDIIEDYRKENYTQTCLSRFKKELVGAADRDSDGYITQLEIGQLLENIGADELMTKEEISDVFTELGFGGDESKTGIPVVELMKIL
mmetsp:Transcript_34385/g.41509  ORF Transcript_34385/g.41509 Transcript_34385/m.41509 type:complete len:166 (+) Transcript_34385:145-642(+)